jgi:hypothetical protein
MASSTRTRRRPIAVAVLIVVILILHTLLALAADAAVGRTLDSAEALLGLAVPVRVALYGVPVERATLASLLANSMPSRRPWDATEHQQLQVEYLMSYTTESGLPRDIKGVYSTIKSALRPSFNVSVY